MLRSVLLFPALLKRRVVKKSPLPHVVRDRRQVSRALQLGPASWRRGQRPVSAVSQGCMQGRSWKRTCANRVWENDRVFHLLEMHNGIEDHAANRPSLSAHGACSAHPTGPGFRPVTRVRISGICLFFSCRDMATRRAWSIHELRVVSSSTCWTFT